MSLCLHWGSILTPKPVPAHPILSQKDQSREWAGHTLVIPRCFTGSKSSSLSMVSSLLPRPHPLKPDPQGAARKERTILYWSQTSLKGMSLLWLMQVGGGDKNLRWNDLVCKVLADGGKSCHLLNFAKCSGSRPPRVECKVSPAFHLRSSQDRGGGQRCFLRSRMLTSDGTEFKTRTAMTYSSHFPSLAPLGVKIPQKE